MKHLKLKNQLTHSLIFDEIYSNKFSYDIRLTLSAIKYDTYLHSSKGFITNIDNIYDDISKDTVYLPTEQDEQNFNNNFDR